MEGAFKKLVEELNLEERAKMLEKLNSQSNLRQGLLYEDEVPEKEIETTLEIRFGRLPWYQKLWFKIVSIFNSRPPIKLFEDHLMFTMARLLEEKTPGFYNYHRDVLLPKFHEMLIYLRDGSRFFYNALDAGVNREKGGLLVFLGSLEMPNIHRAIQSHIDPAAMSEQNPKIGNIELTQKAHRNAEEILNTLSAEQRGSMYLNARSLHCLKQLAAFHFDRLINAFSEDPAFEGAVCPSALIRDQIYTLNNILHSLREPPSMALLGSLFIFVLSEQENEQGFDIHAEMRKLLARAETSLEAIRDFNRQVPLTGILRCISRNMNLSPQNIGGGEDWFTAYRDQWKAIIDENFFSFVQTRRQRELQNTLKYFLKGTSLKPLKNMETETNPSGVPVKGAFILSFLQTFYSAVFMPELNPVLRPIMLDGEFVKKENKTEFIEYYNNIIKLEDLIWHFDSNLSPEGDYGKTYAQAKAEMIPLQAKRRKIQIILDETAGVGAEIIEQTKYALVGMVKVLGGIVNGDEKSGTLLNLPVLSKKEGFVEGLQKCLDQFDNALNLINEINAMEERQ